MNRLPINQRILKDDSLDPLTAPAASVVLDASAGPVNPGRRIVNILE